MAVDLYDILGVAADANADALRLAYYRQVRQHHPDAHAGQSAISAGGAVAAEADDPDQLLQIIEAYRVLRDPATRAAYDRTRMRAPTSGASSAARTGGLSQPAARGWRGSSFRDFGGGDLLRAVGPVRRHTADGAIVSLSGGEIAALGEPTDRYPDAARSGLLPTDIVGYRGADNALRPIPRTWLWPF